MVPRPTLQYSVKILLEQLRARPRYSRALPPRLPRRAIDKTARPPLGSSWLFGALLWAGPGPRRLVSYLLVEGGFSRGLTRSRGGIFGSWETGLLPD